MTELEIAAKNVKDKFDMARIKTGIQYKCINTAIIASIDWNTSTRYSNSKGGSTYLRY